MLADRRHLPVREGYETKTTITPKKTLVASPGVKMRGEEDAHGRKPVPQIGVGEIYNIMLAERWAMPRTFQTGHKGRERWAAKGRDAGDYEGDVRKMYEGLRHPSVPRWTSDTIHRAAADTEIVGNRLSKGTRTYCKRCKGLETITHKYGTCEQIEKAWGIMLKRWGHMTGEHLRPTYEWVTRWGVRWGDTGGRQKGKNEEVSRNIHAIQVAAIQEESTRKRWRGAGSIYQRACTLVQQMATNTRHHRGKAFQAKRNGLTQDSQSRWEKRGTHRVGRKRDTKASSDRKRRGTGDRNIHGRIS